MSCLLAGVYSVVISSLLSDALQYCLLRVCTLYTVQYNICCQYSYISCLQPTISYQQSTTCSLQFTICCRLQSTLLCTFCKILSTVLSSTAYYLLSTVVCMLSTIFCILSALCCLKTYVLGIKSSLCCLKTYVLGIQSSLCCLQSTYNLLSTVCRGKSPLNIPLASPTSNQDLTLLLTSLPSPLHPLPFPWPVQ